jgi:drug/metabolite transporter (DMT)-like permease
MKLISSSGTSTRGTIFGFIAIIFWSSTIAFSRTLIEHLGSLTAGSLIYLISGLFSCGIILLQKNGFKQLTHQPKPYLLVCGGLFVIYIAALYLAIGLAVTRTEVLIVGLLNYLWPTLSIVFSLPILKNKASPFLPVGIVLAMFGIILASTLGNNSLTVLSFTLSSLIPYALALIAAISWGLYSNFSRRIGPESEAGGVPLFLLASGILLGLVRITVHESSTWDFRTVLMLLYMSAFPALLAYTFWDLAMRKGNMNLVVSASYLTPIFSTIISVFVLNVPATSSLWLGTAIVIVGAFICKRSIQS